MKIAIIGAGFSGLAAAWHLSREHEVIVFDAGGGASMVSTGLLHPYPGEQGRRSWKADEAMAATKELLKAAEEILGHPVAHYGGILKMGECIAPNTRGEDVEQIGPNQFLIHSGITVFPKLYLEALRKKIDVRSVHIESLDELAEFDCIVIAAGAGIRNFPECSHLKINFVKGQVLTCRASLERSVVAKQYLALSETAGICHLGATYERDFTFEEPCLETAMKLLKPDKEILDCRAGIRVTNPAHYFPILEKINPKTWAITAMGSRGLLYHAYFGQLLADQIRIGL